MYYVCTSVNGHKYRNKIIKMQKFRSKNQIIFE